MNRNRALLIITAICTIALSSCSSTGNDILDEPDRSPAADSDTSTTVPAATLTPEQAAAYAEAGIKVAPSGMLWAEDCADLRNAHLPPTAQARC